MILIPFQYGRQLLDSYRSLVDDLAQEDLDLLAHARSCSVSSIAGGGTGQPAGTPCSHSGSEPDQDQDQLQSTVAVTPTYNHNFHSTVDGLPGQWVQNLDFLLREQRALKVFENKALMRILGPNRDEVTARCRNLHNEVLHNLYSSPNNRLKN